MATEMLDKMSGTDSNLVTEYEMGVIRSKAKRYEAKVDATHRININRLMQDETDCGNDIGFCGLRTAVFSVNLAHIVIIVVVDVILELLGRERVEHLDDVLDDDALKESINEQFNNFSLPWFVVIQSIRVMIRILAVAGAYFYHIQITGACFAAYGIEWVIAVLRLKTEDVLMVGFLVYIQFLFLHQLYRGGSTARVRGQSETAVEVEG